MFYLLLQITLKFQGKSLTMSVSRCDFHTQLFT